MKTFLKVQSEMKLKREQRLKGSVSGYYGSLPSLFMSHYCWLQSTNSSPSIRWLLPPALFALNAPGVWKFPRNGSRFLGAEEPTKPPTFKSLKLPWFAIPARLRFCSTGCSLPTARSGNSSRISCTCCSDSSAIS